MGTGRRGWVAALPLTVGLLGLVAVAVAQQAQQAPRPDPARMVLGEDDALALVAAQGAPGGEAGRGPGRGQGMMGGPPPMMGGTEIAATDFGVFVVSGGKLLKYDVDTLKKLAEADLPRPEPPQQPPR